MKKDSIVKSIGLLWSSIARGNGKSEHESDRSENGDYGSRTDATVYQFKADDFEIVCRKVETITWTEYKDHFSKHDEIEITKKEKVIFSARRYGGSKTDRFTGGEERYSGSERTSGDEDWTVIVGKLPKIKLSKKD